jgi:Glycosyltransferases involved in cell wall biogenesis
LQSIVAQQFAGTFEVIIVEDGSKNTCKDIVTAFAKQLDLAYHYKPNTGAGDSRNFGMQHAKGNYFIILDSDVLLPKHYLTEVQQTLTKNSQMPLVAQMLQMLALHHYKKE